MDQYNLLNHYFVCQIVCYIALINNQSMAIKKLVLRGTVKAATLSFSSRKRNHVLCEYTANATSQAEETESDKKPALVRGIGQPGFHPCQLFLPLVSVTEE